LARQSTVLAPVAARYERVSELRVVAACCNQPAGCGMLVAGGLCYRMLSDDGQSLVSRKVHRLLRVPPTGGLPEKHCIVRFFLGRPPSAGANPSLRA